MRFATSILLLLLAAILEAGGDALVRTGLHADAARRAGWFAAGAVVLFSYGYLVNTPPWDFGRLLGIYIVLFFLVSQLIAWAVFHQRPSGTMMAGGLLIVAGGIVISWEMIGK